MRTEIGRMEAFDALLETLLKPPARQKRAPAPSKHTSDGTVRRSRKRNGERKLPIDSDPRAGNESHGAVAGRLP